MGKKGNPEGLEYGVWKERPQWRLEQWLEFGEKTQMEIRTMETVLYWKEMNRGILMGTLQQDPFFATFSKDFAKDIIL